MNELKSLCEEAHKHLCQSEHVEHCAWKREEHSRRKNFDKWEGETHKYWLDMVNKYIELYGEDDLKQLILARKNKKEVDKDKLHFFRFRYRQLFKEVLF